MITRRTGMRALVLVTGVSLAACGSSSGSSGAAKESSTTVSTTPKAAGPITISAAASLTEAFGEIGTDFSSANPGAPVTFNFGSSGTVATQIEQGAPADAF